MKLEKMCEVPHCKNLGEHNGYYYKTNGERTILRRKKCGRHNGTGLSSLVWVCKCGWKGDSSGTVEISSDENLVLDPKSARIRCPNCMTITAVPEDPSKVKLNITKLPTKEDLSENI